MIPNVIADGTHKKFLTPQLIEVLPGIHIFLVEEMRAARRYLSSLKIYSSIESLNFAVLDKDTTTDMLPLLLEGLFEGHDVGVISEAGCPGIADPGSKAVLYAHQHNFQVIPLVGPSSILLAMMGSGLNGQKFAFQGYLPVEKQKAALAIKDFEKESRLKNQTQIFIETPYRNKSVTDLLLKNLHAETLLTIAVDLTGVSETIRTKSVKEWRVEMPVFERIPAVFLFLAQG